MTLTPERARQYHAYLVDLVAAAERLGRVVPPEMWALIADLSEFAGPASPTVDGAAVAEHGPRERGPKPKLRRCQYAGCREMIPGHDSRGGYCDMHRQRRDRVLTQQKALSLFDAWSEMSESDRLARLNELMTWAFGDDDERTPDQFHDGHPYRP